MLVSVIIPVYNKEEYLDDCLKSLVNQVYRNIEIIIINDGSKDNSNSVIKKYASKDSRIKYFSQDNKGVAFTRNRGLSIATGEYVFFLDADDLLEKNSISKLVFNAKQTKADIVIGNYSEKSNGKITKKPELQEIILKKDDLKSKETILDMFILNARPLSVIWNKLYNIEFIRKNRIEFENGVLAEDRLFNLRCYINNPVIQIINEYTFIYNIVENSRSRSFDSNYYNESISLLKILNKYLRDDSKFENNSDLLQLNCMYDIYKLLSYTFRYSNQKVSSTIYVLKELKKETLVTKTISQMLKNRSLKNYNGGKTYKRMRLICYLFSYAPFLIIIYKKIGQLSRGIRFNNKK